MGNFRMGFSRTGGVRTNRPALVQTLNLITKLKEGKTQRETKR